MITFFVDSPVFLHALGEPGAATAASQELLRRAGGADVELHTAAECVQEVAFHRIRMGDRTLALRQVDALRDLCLVHPFDDPVIDLGLHLMGSTQIRGRDAFIAATAILAGFDRIVTTDARFVEVPGLTTVDPRRLDL